MDWCLTPTLLIFLLHRGVSILVNKTVGLYAQIKETAITMFVYRLISFTNLKIVSPATFVNTFCKSYKLLTL